MRMVGSALPAEALIEAIPGCRGRSLHRAEQVLLAAAVLILRRPTGQDQTAPGNVFLLRPDGA